MTTTTRKFIARSERGAILGTLEMLADTFAPDLVMDQHNTAFVLRPYGTGKVDSYGNPHYYRRARWADATLHVRRKRARR